MKWWYWLGLELLIIFGIMVWIYFFPSVSEVDLAKAMIGFVTLDCLEEVRKRMNK